MLAADLPSLDEPDRAYVERRRMLSPALAAARDLALRFGALIRARTTNALTPWLADAGSSGLRGFAAGLRQDEQAVRAALTLAWSSGDAKGKSPASSWSNDRAMDEQGSTCSGRA